MMIVRQATGLLLLSAAVVVQLGVQTTRGQVGKLYPIDEAYEDSTFISFRLHVLEAVAARDTTFLFAHLDSGIRTSFGTGGGIEDFKQHWKPSSPESDLWKILGRVIGGGGTHEEGRFQAPYYFAAFPGEVHDPFQHGVVIGANVNVRSRPDVMSSVMTQLSYEIVRVEHFPAQTDRNGATSDWVQVRLEDGREGYVSSRYMGSPVGYRAVFHRVDGQWMIGALVAGD